MLVDYKIIRRETDVPLQIFERKPESSHLYEYLLAANGVFLRAERENLHVCFPVAHASIRGLQPLDPYVETLLPRVPSRIVKEILDQSVQACVAAGTSVEALFHLFPEHGDWQSVSPRQEANHIAVKPTETGEGSSYERALIELHSHHSMKAFFSGQDNRDEQGFRIYAVLGEIFSRPTLRVRVGCFGYFYEIPARSIFELPGGVRCHFDGRVGSDGK
ncbi:MAG: hypothetical protein ACR2LC_09440 [Pyrinomonadaceae bacterium]